MWRLVVCCMLKRISGWSTKRKWVVGCLAGIAVLFVVSAIVSALESEETKAARAEATAVAVQAKEAQEAEKRKSGLHCLSPLDGHHDGFQRLVKQQMNDPDSVEARETLIGKVSVGVSSFGARQGKHVIVMDYTAKNPLDGTVRAQAVGYVDSESCQAENLVKVQ